MVTTIHGDRDESTLRRVDGALDTADEYTTWVEYYEKDELVHRSVHVTLKKWPEGLGTVLGSFGS